MIVSPKFKAIFIHCPKTAGTSIKSVFRREDENLVPLYPHFRVSEGKRMIPKWHNYFRFSSVRHPCDVLASHYLHIARNEEHPYHWHVSKKGMTFSDWLRFYTEEQSDGGYVCAGYLDGPVDMIIRFENLEKDMDVLFDRLRIENRMIPKFNVATNRQGPWQDYFKDGDVDYVLEHYSEDFRRFNYSV